MSVLGKVDFRRNCACRESLGGISNATHFNGRVYNTTNYETAIGPMGGKDDWHHRVWWDAYEINVKYDEHK